MNAMPSPPPNDPSQWFSVAEHIEAILAFIGGVALTAGVAIWRMAVWTTSVKNEIAAMREASEARQKTILDIMVENEKHAHGRHEAIQREMDQIREIAREDREEQREHRAETREARDALSARMDNALARRD